MIKGWERVSHLFDGINIVVIPTERIKCPKLLPPKVKLKTLYPNLIKSIEAKTWHRVLLWSPQ